ncbi:uncharacterized protein JCM6883_003224 [Sporobolomyces salmoneus]|uniref:uncharacterized protein n=1 Tax=Sporobolomyces salmoneus TaxID=183962 RepID=UPI00316D3926
MNPYHQAPAQSPHNSPRYGPYAAMTSPPPLIHVSMAEHQVRINPSPLAHHPPSFPRSPPPASQIPPSLGRPGPTLAQQEKEQYYARSHQLQQQQVAPPMRMKGPIPSPIALPPPPRAAFAQSPSDSPLQSPVSLRQAQEFGDAGSIRSGSGSRVGLLPAEKGGIANAETRGTDWSRYSVLVNTSYSEKRSGKSEWLQRRMGKEKKWWIVGWTCSILLIVAIVVGVVVGVRNHKNNTDDGVPTIPNLGVFNSKEVHSVTSTPSAISTVSFPSPSSSIAKSVSSAAARSSTASLMEDTVETELSNAQATTTPVSVASTRAVVVSTSSRQITTTSSSSAAVQRSTTSAEGRSSTSFTSALTTSQAAATSKASHRKRFLNHASFVALKASFFEETFGKAKRDSAEIMGLAGKRGM